MKLPKDTTCGVCKKIFCCGKCREKHEIKTHPDVLFEKNKTEQKSNENIDPLVQVLCPICDNKPFPLHEVINIKILEHIKLHHLPLHCRKCAKVYTKVDDLSEFSKCIKNSTALNEKHCLPVSDVHLKNSIFNFGELETQQTTSTQTPPILDNGGCTSLIPISLINMNWKARTSKIQDISDSVSSIKNISIISNSSSIRHSLGSAKQTKGKLVRTTSTPVYTETYNEKPKERTFNASEAQVSSIYNSGCEVEQHHSPIKHNSYGATPALQPQPEAVNLYKKFNNRTKVAAVTPLRQVMSKSIQKAFAEHGLPSFSEQKLMPSNDIVGANSPLDLRLSPALRRHKSDVYCIGKNNDIEKETKLKKNIVQSTTMYSSPKKTFEQKLTTESFVYTCTQEISTFEVTANELKLGFSTNSDTEIPSTSDNTIYKTCDSMEIANNLVDKNNDELGLLEVMPHALNTITPITRQSGATITKKAIKFESPTNENDSNSKTPSNELFYTPKSSPRMQENLTQLSAAARSEISRNLSGRFSPSRRPSIRECAQSTAFSHCYIDQSDANDEVFLSATSVEIPNDNNCNSSNDNSTSNGGFFWCLVNSVMRLPDSRDSRRKIDKEKKETSIIQRCASIAGSLVRSTSLVDEKQFQSLKRKRTYTIDGQSNPHKPLLPMDTSPILDTTACKRLRIQGRKPIERLRNNS